MSIEEFIITRHGLSCANILNTVSSHDTWKAVAHKTVTRAFNNPDPSLAIWGIINTLYMSSKYTYQPIVHVSCLVRTWITAFLLYAPSCARDGNNNVLTLKRAPFLREDARGSSNQCPDDTAKQIEKFKRMLSFVKTLMSEESVCDLLPSIGPVVIKLYLNKVTTIHFDTITTIDIPANIVPYVKNIWESISSTTHVEYQSRERIREHVIPKIEHSDLREPNLMNFIGWWYSTKNERTCHVVAHHNIMETFVRNLFNDNSIDWDRIHQQNTWSIHLKIQNQQIISITVKEGMNEPVNGSPYVHYRCEMLCDSFFDDSICQSKCRGGTYKKRTKRRKRLSHSR